MHAGAPVIECEMVEDDFRELAAAGVKLLGEVGLGGVKDGPTARKMVAWARKYGIQSTIHTGGPSIPGSGLIDKDVVLEADTDVIGHINGGHTALPDDQIRCICEGCKRGLELVHNGNERAALFTLRTAREMGELERVILGTDAPAGSGVQPLGILRMVSMLSSLGDVPAEIAFCFATGNTARMRELDCGLIEVGRAADFVLMDKAQHSAGKNLLDSVQLGDLPGIGMTIIDGIVRTQRSRNTPPAGKVPEIVVGIRDILQQSGNRFASRIRVKAKSRAPARFSRQCVRPGVKITSSLESGEQIGGLIATNAGRPDGHNYHHRGTFEEFAASRRRGRRRCHRLCRNVAAVGTGWVRKPGRSDHVRHAGAIGVCAVRRHRRASCCSARRSPRDGWRGGDDRDGLFRSSLKASAVLMGYCAAAGASYYIYAVNGNCTSYNPNAPNPLLVFEVRLPAGSTLPGSAGDVTAELQTDLNTMPGAMQTRNSSAAMAKG